MPEAKAPHSLGYPPSPGREVPSASRLGPGSGRAVGTVSISRGALLEKEQKPREAINSHLLHTSASTAPASRGRRGPAAWPGLSPTAKPPSASPSQHLHLKNRGNNKPGNICRRSRTGSEQRFAKLPSGSAQPQPRSPRGLPLPSRALHPETPRGHGFHHLGMLLLSLALSAAGREQEEPSGSGRPTFKALILFA